MKKSFIIILPVFFLMLWSCEQTIEFEDNETNPMIVVNGKLQPGDTVCVSIKKSNSVLESSNYFESLPDATVKLYVDGVFREELTYLPRIDTFIENMNYDFTKIHEYQNGEYVSKNLVVQTGSTYRLEVSNDGYPSATCETTVPLPVEIESLSVKYEAIEDDYGSFSYIIRNVMSFTDPGAKNNYYNLRVEGGGGYDKNSKKYSYYFNSYTYDNDGFTPSDTILLNLGQGVYINSSDPLFDNNETGNIFDMEYGYSTIFNDELINGKHYSLVFDIYIWTELYIEYGEFYTTTALLDNLSPELYLYMVSVEKQYMVEDNPFAEPVPVYSNVEGGLGIFGSMAISSFEATVGEYPVDGKYYIPFKEYYEMYNE